MFNTLRASIKFQQCAFNCFKSMEVVELLAVLDKYNGTNFSYDKCDEAVKALESKGYKIQYQLWNPKNRCPDNQASWYINNLSVLDMNL